MSNPAPHWKTKKEAALYMGVSTSTVDRWVRDGALPAYVLPSGRTRRFKTSDLDALAAPASRVELADDDEGNPPAA